MVETAYYSLPLCSLAATAASQRWFLSLHLRSFRTKEKEICFQLEKLTFICSQPVPCIEHWDSKWDNSKVRTTDPVCPNTLVITIFHKILLEKNAHGAITVLHGALWVPEKTLSRTTLLIEESSKSLPATNTPLVQHSGHSLRNLPTFTGGDFTSLVFFHLKSLWETIDVMVKEEK